MKLVDLIEELNAYDGIDVWGDLIYPEGFDLEATEALDPSCRSDVFVTLDGDVVIRSEQTGGWVAYTPAMARVPQGE